MNGVLAVLALVVDLLLLGDAKHSGISPRSTVREGRDAADREKAGQSRHPGILARTDDRSRKVPLDSLEDDGPKEGSTFWR
jgi:hypothetical protein